MCPTNTKYFKDPTYVIFPHWNFPPQNLSPPKFPNTTLSPPIFLTKKSPPKFLCTVYFVWMGFFLYCCAYRFVPNFPGAINCVKNKRGQLLFQRSLFLPQAQLNCDQWVNGDCAEFASRKGIAWPSSICFSSSARYLGKCGNGNQRGDGSLTNSSVTRRRSIVPRKPQRLRSRSIFQILDQLCLLLIIFKRISF